MDRIFSRKDIKLTELRQIIASVNDLEPKKKIVRQWQKSLASGKLAKLSETQLDVQFTHQIFGEVLNYAYNEAQTWNIDIKPKTETDSTRPDAVLGYFGTEQESLNRVVIELKGANINLDKNQNRKDFKGSPVDQAFSYAHKMRGQCHWVIVSNFLEIRLYHASDSSRYEKFEIQSLLEEDNFAYFLFFLQKDQLFLQNAESRIEQLYAEKRAKEIEITNQFYNEYQAIREVLFSNLWKNNPTESPFEILRITQKIIDRVIFIAFVRDVIPMADIFYEAFKSYETSFSRRVDRFWQEVKDVFDAFDVGYSPKIPQFNGGLFKPDFSLDNIKIKDFYIIPLIRFSSKYDFQSELNVNILGHIFEQSIADIELMKQDFEIINPLDLAEVDLQTDQKKIAEVGLRKKDGIFYTPNFITKYLVQQTVGAFLEQKKEELLAKYQTENLEFWQNYTQVLTQIKVLDPACGSGAFLTAVFDELWKEWKIALTEIEKIKDENQGKKAQNDAYSGMFGNIKEETQSDWQIKKTIVQNNIFGVDLNGESVEISKLAMWLLTANRFTTLADLSGNIKQGNSLISDKNTDSRAFDWQAEFGFDFDVIVGNPPYVSANNMDFKQRQYFNQSQNYKHLQGKWDLFVPFFERGLNLLQAKGILSFIVPYGLLNQPFATNLRQWILSDFSLRSIVDLHEVKVFAEATVPTCIPVIFKEPNLFKSINILKHKLDGKDHIFYVSHQIETEKYLHTENSMFRTEKLDLSFDLLQKIKNSGTVLGELFYVSTGAEIHGKEQRSEEGLVSGYSKFEVLHEKNNVGFKPYIEGASITKSRKLGAYCYPQIDYYLDYDNNFERMRSPKFKELFESPKIIVRVLAGLKGILATFDERNIFVGHGNLSIIQKSNLPLKHSDYQENTNYNLKVLLALLNSQLMHFYYMSIYGGFINVYPNYIKSLPIPSAISTEIESQMVKKVEILLELHKNLAVLSRNFIKVLKAEFALQKPSERLELWYNLDWTTFVKEMKKCKSPIPVKKNFEWIEIFEEKRQDALNYLSQSEDLKKQLDNTIYGLYNLSEEEIKMVENVQ